MGFKLFTMSMAIYHMLASEGGLGLEEVVGAVQELGKKKKRTQNLQALTEWDSRGRDIVEVWCS